MDNTTSTMNIVNENNNMDSNMADKSAQKAKDFYSFYRSGNHSEMQHNIVQLARNDTLDKSDLALLALMLTNITDFPTRRLMLGDEQCRSALQTILETVRRTEASHNSKPYENDVMEIENIISAPPISPDVL